MLHWAYVHFCFPSAPTVVTGFWFWEGYDVPVPHEQCFMPVRVPFGFGVYQVIVIPLLSNFLTYVLWVGIL